MCCRLCLGKWGCITHFCSRFITKTILSLPETSRANFLNETKTYTGLYTFGPDPEPRGSLTTIKEVFSGIKASSAAYSRKHQHLILYDEFPLPLSQSIIIIINSTKKNSQALPSLLAALVSCRSDSSIFIFFLATIDLRTSLADIDRPSKVIESNFNWLLNLKKIWAGISEKIKANTHTH